MNEITEVGESQVSLLLSDTQVDMLLEHALVLEEALEVSLRKAHLKGKKREVVLSLYDLDDLEGHVAATANHCDDRKLQAKLDTVLKQINKIQFKNTDSGN